MSLWVRLVRFGFRLLYNEFAFTYDLVSYSVSLGAWRCWQRAALKHLPGDGRVLELAYGTGNLQIDLIEAGYSVYGHDLSPYMMQIARGKLKRKGSPVRLTRGRAQQLPYSDSTFSAVVSTFPTEFVTESPTLAEVWRVMEPGGRFIIVPNAIFTGATPAEAGLEWLYRITGQRAEHGFDVQQHFYQHGFTLHMAEERCPRSVAHVLIAEKSV